MASCSFGCQKADVKDFVPPDEAAKQALTSALDAWKGGKTPDQIGATNPAVTAQDNAWKDGKKLTAYEIVGPATGDDQNRRFTVKLTLEGAAAPQETTYVVFGKDPVWVVSSESYQKMSGM
ncbi:MAG TPA: hypothetical protein VHC22_08065 [Pirellulales bacterium]|nr:hypothetical protein [Pirellulales bacterium]